MHDKPIAAGKSSFDLIEVDKVFAALALEKGSSLLDIACGIGNYSLAAAERIGPDGIVYAVDLWEEGIATLKNAAAARKLNNIKAMVSDVGKSLPVEANSIDLCLMATVLHDLIEIKADRTALTETARVLKPGGTFAVIEFKEIEPPPGPPIHIRLSPEKLLSIVEPYGFRQEQQIDIGPYHYLAIYLKK